MNKGRLCLVLFSPTRRLLPLKAPLMLVEGPDHLSGELEAFFSDKAGYSSASSIGVGVIVLLAQWFWSFWGTEALIEV
jgi:hypothetical protein